MKVKFPARMSKKTAIELSIKHWQRMIRWAKKQNLRRRVDHGICGDIYSMQDAIKENPSSYSCALCKKHCSGKYQCLHCPLLRATNGDGCGYLSPWRSVRDSITWGTWIQNAEKMLLVLKELR